MKPETRAPCGLSQTSAHLSLLQDSGGILGEDLERVLAAISRVRDEMARLEQLGDFDGAMGATYQCKVACHEFIDQYRPLLHPMRHIPSEILSEIFALSTEDYTRIPWNVSHVCRQWRVIALDTPQLWCRVPYVWKFPGVAAERRFITFLASDYLRRSGNRPIIFSWHPWNPLAHKLYLTLLQHVNRWGDVQLHLDEGVDKHFRRRLNRLEGRLCSLHSLKLAIFDKVTTTTLMPFQSALKLRRLAIKIRPDEMTLPTAWPWNQVTHLSLSSDHNLQCVDYRLLSSFTQLFYIKLKWSPRPQVLKAEHLDQKFVFETCKCLHLDLTHGSGFQRGPCFYLLRAMSFPSLEHLFISYNTSNDPECLLEIASFLGRINDNSTRLRSFHWHRVCRYTRTPPPIDQDYMECTMFNHLPRDLPVLRLTLPSRNLWAKILNNLETDGDFLPGLQKLDIAINVDDMEAEERDYICKSLNAIVNAPGRRLDELRLQVVQKSPMPAQPVLPWELVVKLDGWHDGLRADSSAKTATKVIESNLLSLELPATVNNCSDMLSNTDLPNQLRRVMVNLMRSDPYSRLEPSKLPPSHKEEIPNSWVLSFVEDVENRHWTIAGDDSVLYIPSQSSLRGRNSIWVWGVEDYNDQEPSYLDENRIPGGSPTWPDMRITHWFGTMEL